MTKPLIARIEKQPGSGVTARADTQQQTLIKPLPFAPSDGKSGRWQRRINPLAVCLWLALVLIVLAATFVFTARSLVIVTDPARADIQIRGAMALPLAARYLLRPGHYEITASAEGYHPLTQPLTVTQEQNQQLHLSLEKKPGLLLIHAQPAQAIDIRVDGKATPFKPGTAFKLSAGEHVLELSAARFLPYTLPLTVAGKGKQQTHQVSLKPAWANATISSTPVNATVSINGKALGLTPLQTEILQGKHRIVFKHPGYEPLTQHITVVAGQNLQITSGQLKLISAQLQLTSQPTQANVTFNGQFKGQTPLQLTVRPNTSHELAVFSAGYHSKTQRLKLSPGEKKALTVTLKPQLGSVKILTKPAQVQLYINGSAITHNARTLKLPAYKHVLEVRKPGYQSQRHIITPRPGFEQTLAITLLTEHQARWANVKPRITTSAGQPLLLLHPGQFVMGASRREAGRRANETLQRVHMKRAFYLATTEVTNAQFRLFKADHSSGHVQGHSLDGDLQPVVNITWQQAAAYCNWLSKRDQLTPFYQIDNTSIRMNFNANGYRLPTEAEWAWAARVKNTVASNALTTNNTPINKTLFTTNTQATKQHSPTLKFPWGAQMPPPAGSGNYADMQSAAITGQAISRYQDGFIVSAPVASFAANQHGLFDMGGNVAEWINDYYGLSNRLSHKVQTDPTGPLSGQYRVVRGSSWTHATVTELRLSFRDYGREQRNDVGFRLARYVE